MRRYTPYSVCHSAFYVMATVKVIHRAVAIAITSKRIIGSLSQRLLKIYDATADRILHRLPHGEE